MALRLTLLSLFSVKVVRADPIVFSEVKSQILAGLDTSSTYYALLSTALNLAVEHKGGDTTSDILTIVNEQIIGSLESKAAQWKKDVDDSVGGFILEIHSKPKKPITEEEEQIHEAKGEKALASYNAMTDKRSKYSAACLKLNTTLENMKAPSSCEETATESLSDCSSFFKMQATKWRDQLDSCATSDTSAADAALASQEETQLFQVNYCTTLQIGRSRCKAWLDRVDAAYEKHNITYTASQNFFATAQTVYIAAQKIKCIIEKSNADCVALNPSTKPVDPNTTLESSTWDKSCGGTLNTAKYAILFPTNRTGEELCKKFDKVDFVDMGQGFCVDARGELPERSYLREEGPQCEELCAKKPGCLAYTVSASNNCIMWKQPVSKGGGAQWGDNTKCLSKGR